MSDEYKWRLGPEGELILPAGATEEDIYQYMGEYLLRDCKLSKEEWWASYNKYLSDKFSQQVSD